MNKSILAIFCILLIISSPVSAAFYGYGGEDDPQNLGEALIINVDHIEPTPIRSDYFQNREFNSYVFLEGQTLGTMLFGDGAPGTAPFYGDMKIRSIQLTPNKEASKYIAGLSPIVRPKGEELTIDSNGDINLGYTRVRFKRMPREEEVPDTIDIDVTARIYFDVNTGFGSFGTQSLNLQAYPDEDNWKESALEESKIWGGRGYLRVIEITGNSAKVQLYDGGLRKLFLGGSETLVSGSEAKQFHLPGAPTLLENFLTVKLDEINRDPNHAKLMVEDYETKTVSTINVVKGMKPFMGSSWEIKAIYGDRVVFTNEDGENKILDLEITDSSNGDPCSNSNEVTDLGKASSKDLYCQAIKEYKSAISSDPMQKSILYDSYIGIARTYDGLFEPERALEYYQLAKDVDPTKFESEYNMLFEGVQKRIQNALSSIMLDDSLISLLSIDIGGDTDSFLYGIKESETQVPNLQKASLDSVLVAGAIDGSNKYNWVVTAIDANSVTIEQDFVASGTGGLQVRQRTLELGRNNVVPYTTSGTKIIYLDKINIAESAIVTVSPGTRKNYGTSEFSIHIPIEKRLWDWTPEEIDKLIDTTENSMVKLDKIIDKLGNVIKTWKAVCFGTFAILSVKNAFFRNPAKKLAQDRAKQRCSSTEDPEGCYQSEETQRQIEEETDQSEKALDTTKDVMDGFSWEEDDSDGKAAVQRAADELDISEEELRLLNKYQGLTTEELSEVMHNRIAWEDETEWNQWKEDKLDSAKKIDEAVKEEIGGQKLGEYEKAAIEFKYMNAERTKTETYSSEQFREDREEAINDIIDKKYDKPKRVTGTDKEPLPVRTENGRNYVYISENGKISRIAVEEIRHEGELLEGHYYNQDTGEIYLGGNIVNNYMVGYQGSTTVQYDENTKRPVLIPFQYKDNDLPSYLGFANYIVVDESASYHYSVWNVGPDGNINSQDDQLVVSSSQLMPGNRLPGYDRLANEIERSHTQASVGKAGDDVIVRGQKYATGVFSGQIGRTTGSPGSCEEIMSPGDCKILYNVCDPVMCPPSRFNLGGRWNVLGTGSVVQKGIIGSLVLGWGNGDLLPICLTGIHAGLENIYSMFGSFRDCLETSKVKGESVGICNEIRSLYMCDIIWQEALALVNVFGKLSSWVSTSVLGTSSGGEYKFWESSWSQLGDSVSFFTKDYASSAFAAFTSRSTDEIGTEICKAAIFGKFPAGGDLLGQLTSPESPPQFTGWFEEDRFTDVNLETGFIPSSTVGTGQSVYRIYYHIYAGRDRDVTYRVVLKDITGRVIPVTDERTLSSGKRFLKKGESVDKSFVLPNLPPGFTQMCIIIDEAEHCGFGSISSSFTAEYLKQQIVQGQMGKIESAEDCIPEQRSYIPGALTSGVRRVCSVYDPDGVGEDWEYVGTCGFDEQGRNLGNCYLYAEGVEQSIINSALEARVDASFDQRGTEAPTDKEKEFEVYLAEKANQEFEEIVLASKEAKTTEEKNKIVKRYHSFAERAPNNDMTSEAYYKVGELIRELADRTFVSEEIREIEASAASCSIDYDAGSAVRDKAVFQWANNKWVILTKATVINPDVTVGTKIEEITVNVNSASDCEILSNHDSAIYEICKVLVGSTFEEGSKNIAEVANVKEDQLTVRKDDGSEYKPEKRKASYQSIIDLCLKERVTAPPGEFEKLIGKEIEVECLTFNELANKYTKQNIYFADGLVNVEGTSTRVSSMDKFVDYVYGICYGDGRFNRIKVQREDFEKTLYKRDEEEGNINVKTWLKNLLLGEVVDEHNPFELKLYREGGIFGIDTKEDYTFIWNGYMLEKMAKSQGNPDDQLNIVDWGVALNIMWLTYKEEFRDVKKVEFKCADSEVVRVFNAPGVPFSIDTIETEFRRWVDESSQACGGRVISSDIESAIQLAKSEVINNRKCDCGSDCEDYSKWIQQYADESGVDPILILALMMQESQCRASESSTSSHGLMQINTRYHCDKYGLSADREECAKQLRENPEVNIRLGVEILKSFYDIYNTKGFDFNGCNKQQTYYGWEAALRAYNGPGCDPRYPEQDNFVEDVMERYNYLLSESGDYTEITYSANDIARNAQEEYLTWNQGQRDECASGMQDELTAYWRAVGWGPEAWDCDVDPWSAAFVSYVMKESGVNFPANSAHSRYFMDIKENPDKYDCQTYDVQTDLDKIQVGDILCANRGGSSKTYRTLVRGDTTHCDVVTSPGSSIKAIGGNVGDSVSETTVTRSKVQIKGSNSYFGFISC